MRRREIVSRATLPIAGVAVTLHFVALVEAFVSGRMAGSPLHQSESLLAFLMMVLFIGVFYLYRTTSPGIVVLPIAFLLSLSAALAQSAPPLISPQLRSGWIYTHIILILIGYSALFFSFIASVLYLLHERSLKRKDLNGIAGKLPARSPLPSRRAPGWPPRATAPEPDRRGPTLLRSRRISCSARLPTRERSRPACGSTITPTCMRWPRRPMAGSIRLRGSSRRRAVARCRPVRIRPWRSRGWVR